MKFACVWLYILCFCDSRCLWIIIYFNNVVIVGNGGWFFFILVVFRKKCFWGILSDKYVGTLN